jgi:hypothetical protein
LGGKDRTSQNRRSTWKTEGVSQTARDLGIQRIEGFKRRDLNRKGDSLQAYRELELGGGGWLSKSGNTGVKGPPDVKGPRGARHQNIEARMRLVDRADCFQIRIHQRRHQRAGCGIIHVDGVQSLPLINIADVPAYQTSVLEPAAMEKPGKTVRA